MEEIMHNEEIICQQIAYIYAGRNWHELSDKERILIGNLEQAGWLESPQAGIVGRILVKVKNMDDFEQKKSNFLYEINEELGPVLRIVEGQRNTFFVQLCETKYAAMDQVVTDSALDSLITDLSFKYFSQAPQFNNTHRCFWFSNVGEIK